jgi:hypothetical protein
MFEREKGRLECRVALLTAGSRAAVLSGVVHLSRRELTDELARIESGAIPAKEMARFGAGVARLLLPEAVREGLSAMAPAPVVVLHDFEASRVPWETVGVGKWQPALDSGMSRRYASEHLSVARWREDGGTGDTMRVLLIVNPTRDLPGAAAEGERLFELLSSRGAEVELVEGPAANRRRLLRELRSGRYDIMHFAGHGFFDEEEPGRSGLLCAGDEILRGADLTALANLPSVVFFNACEAARVRRPTGRRPRGLLGIRRSTSIAESFLEHGVANFVGTHWPVGDEAALQFSTSFYDLLLTGASLGDSMLGGRRKVRALGSVDWADYVHYGNPAFRLVGSDHPRP